MAKPSQQYAREVFIVDGCRTPFLKAGMTTGPFSAADLGVAAGRELLARQPFEPDQVDALVLGCVGPSENEANIARIVALRMGCGDKIPAFTVQRNCASGMQAIDSAAKDIAMGRHELVIAGGAEAMSHSPIMYNRQLRNWLSTLSTSRSLVAKLKVIAKLRPSYLKPVIALTCGLTDPVVGLIMGKTAENLAAMFDISRREMDEFAARSHQRVLQAQQNGYFDEIRPIYAPDGKVYQQDTGVREDSTPEKLAKLRPFFDKHGAVTAGNSSQITDGAAMLLLASADAVKQHGLTPIGRVVDCEWAALDPSIMGLGPTMAATPLMLRHKLKFDDIDFVEINEAFAAQVIACVKAWQDDAFCQTHFDLNKAFGTLSDDKLNIDGGAVAQGHPVGASGARIVLHLLHTLHREKAKRGLAAICIGGGQGGAMLVETV